MKGTKEMDKTRIKKLENAGWKMGDFGDAFALSAEDREIGGLGIFIVKKTMDSVCYRRNGDHNELAITKTL